VNWLTMNIVACIDWIRILLRALIEYESCCVYWLNMNLVACIDWLWIFLRVLIEYESCCVYWLNMNLFACIDWIWILLRVLIKYESCCVYWLNMNLVACIDWSVKWSTVFQNITTSKLSCMHGSYVSGPLRLTWHHEYASHHTCSILLVMHRLNP